MGRCPALCMGEALPLSPLAPALPDACWLPGRPLLCPQQHAHHPAGTLCLQDPAVYPPKDMQQPGRPQRAGQ